MNLDLIVRVLTAIAAIFAAIVSLANKGKLRDLHVQINSRLDALLLATGEQMRAKGNLEGRAEAKMEAAAKMGTTEQAQAELR